MKYFKRIKTDLDPTPFLDEIDSVKSPWDVATGRQDKIPVQREAKAIPLRGLRKSAIGDRKRRDVHESRWTTGSKKYPLGRARIVCRPAGKRVYPHIDRGAYYRLRNRYHFVLTSTHGSWMRAGDEDVRMQQGELWWFDNDQMHEANNDGDEDRIHMIFDMLPAHLAQQVLGKAA